MPFEGFYHIKPSIRKVRFPKGRIIIELMDGRVISAPIDNFPGLKKLPLSKRSKYQIVNDQGLLFRYCDEVYDLRDFINLDQPQIQIHKMRKAG